MNVLDIISEDTLNYGGTRPLYLLNLIDLIKNGKSLSVDPAEVKKYGKTVVIDPNIIPTLVTIYSTVKTGPKGYLESLKAVMPPLPIKDKPGQTILYTKIEKSGAIMGSSKEYNLGYIGEIALGVAASARFLKGGPAIDFNDFINFSKSLQMGAYISPITNKAGQSKKLTMSGQINHTNGKQDKFEVTIIAPGKTTAYFIKILKKSNKLPKEVHGTMMSAIHYANTAEKIAVGLERTANDPNTNLIQVVSDGISDNKGTKADLVMDIDGERINLLSVKTGESQLGQASGHEWQKQEDFFKTVFGVNAKSYKKTWGTTNPEHLTALREIWGKLVIPKIERLTGGDSNKKEAELIKSIATGLIRYSNNINADTGDIETVDIVKLVTDPSSPGYSLLKIDHNLIQALNKVNLIGSYPPSKMGINIHGRIQTKLKNGKIVDKDVSFCRMWSSPSGDTVRTAVAGGPLLDELALIIPNIADPKTDTSKTNLSAPAATAPAATAPAATAPAATATATVGAIEPTGTKGAKPLTIDPVKHDANSFPQWKGRQPKNPGLAPVGTLNGITTNISATTPSYKDDQVELMENFFIPEPPAYITKNKKRTK